MNTAPLSAMGRNRVPGGRGGYRDVNSLNERFAAKTDASLRTLHQALVDGHEHKTRLCAKLNSVESHQDKMRANSKQSALVRNRLVAAYKAALEESRRDESSMRQCLDQMRRLRALRVEKRVALRQMLAENPDMAERDPKARKSTLRRGALMVLLQQAANTMPLWVGGLAERPPPLCGSLPAPDDHEFKPGDAVAALVIGEEALPVPGAAAAATAGPSTVSGTEPEDAELGTDEQNWILAEFVAQHASTSRYEIEDVDEEQKARYMLPRDKLIAVPRWRANPAVDTDALWPVDSVVLALYPQTTCFYKGVVERVPHTPTDDYLIAFEDASYPNGYSPPLAVPQRYVVAYKHVQI